jgi:hypothetical protein
VSAHAGRVLLGQLYEALCGGSAVAKDGYLTWLAPGRPVGNGAVAALVDGHLPEVYADVLRRSRVLRGELSDDERLKVGRYRTLLRGTATVVDPATGEERAVTDDGPMLRAYQEHLAAYLAAELRCNLARVAGGDEWERAGHRYRAQVRRAMDAWLVTGYRDEVEQVSAYLDQINRRDLGHWRRHLAELYDGGLGPCGAPRTALVPADLATGPGWCDYTLTDAMATAVRPFSWRAGRADFGTDPLPGLALRCQFAPAVVSRPWFHAEFLDARGWALPDGELVCDGADPPCGRLVGYPVAVLFARDLRITSPELVAAHRGGRDAWGPFGLRGATSPTPDTLVVPGPQAVGFVNRQLGRTPDPLPALDQARFG